MEVHVRRRFSFVALVVVLAATRLLSQTAMTPQPTIDRKSPALDDLLAADAKFEKLSDGQKWVEGPVWSTRGGFLLWSDIPNNVVHKWQPGGAVSEYLKPSGYSGSEPFTGPEPGSNGLTFDREGHLILCQHGDRRVARMDAPGEFTALASLRGGSPMLARAESDAGGVYFLTTTPAPASIRSSCSFQPCPACTSSPPDRSATA